MTITKTSSDDSLTKNKISVTKWLGKFMQGWGLLIVFIIICTCFALTTPIFVRPSNLINIIRQVSIIGIAAVGTTILMIAGGIDLSIGSSLAFTGIVAALLMTKFQISVPMAVVLSILAAGFIGVINSTFVTYVHVPPLITTLGVMTALRGLGYVITGGLPVYDFPESFKVLGKGYVGPIPIPVLIMVTLFILGYIFLNKNYLGRHFYALGGNEEATRLSGVDINLTRYLSYIICALLTGIAGLILLARINSAQPSAGNGFELDVITAVVLGGVSISGGVGKIQNVLLGVLIIGVISNGLVLLNVHDYYQMVIKGLILLLAVGIDNLGKNV